MCRNQEERREGAMQLLGAFCNRAARRSDVLQPRKTDDRRLRTRKPSIWPQSPPTGPAHFLAFAFARTSARVRRSRKEEPVVGGEMNSHPAYRPPPAMVARSLVAPHIAPRCATCARDLRTPVAGCRRVRCPSVGVCCSRPPSDCAP